MEQLSFDLSQQKDEKTMKDALAREINNPAYEGFFSVTQNKDGKISIKAKTFVAARVKLKGKDKFIEIKNKYRDLFVDCISEHISLSEAEEKALSEKPKEWFQIPISSLDDVLELVEPLSKVYILILSELGGERFGCCARYEQCSDERKCVNPDSLMALACAYKSNLEAGRIFYGKNKNC